ncbi:hypothetical protein CEXT_357971 [Caerostris extrusa]|uniref:Uncharacterized protein n=1 Tax=Caerostris extrusa TaxID=172846 RepID=A0AAV4XWM5_CAEEX|nr:hypothetical protein CEXT_357971 [Caerostris extrusa]
MSNANCRVMRNGLALDLPSSRIGLELPLAVPFGSNRKKPQDVFLGTKKIRCSTGRLFDAELMDFLALILRGSVCVEEPSEKAIKFRCRVASFLDGGPPLSVRGSFLKKF